MAHLQLLLQRVHVQWLGDSDVVAADAFGIAVKSLLLIADDMQPLVDLNDRLVKHLHDRKHNHHTSQHHC